MDSNQRLLTRLDDIGRSLERTDYALDLIGLGSVGLELERLDEYSDLDFFVSVEAGHKSAFLSNLDWLSAIYPVAYHFRNTDDGYKLLFEDGIFCEMAVLESPEPEAIPFALGASSGSGRMWTRPSLPPSDERHWTPSPSSGDLGRP